MENKTLLEKKLEKTITEQNDQLTELRETVRELKSRLESVQDLKSTVESRDRTIDYLEGQNASHNATRDIITNWLLECDEFRDGILDVVKDGVRYEIDDAIDNLEVTISRY